MQPPTEIGSLILITALLINGICFALVSIFCDRDTKNTNLVVTQKTFKDKLCILAGLTIIFSIVFILPTSCAINSYYDTPRIVPPKLQHQRELSSLVGAPMGTISTKLDIVFRRTNIIATKFTYKTSLSKDQIINFYQKRLDEMNWEFSTKTNSYFQYCWFQGKDKMELDFDEKTPDYYYLTFRWQR